VQSEWWKEVIGYASCVWGVAFKYKGGNLAVLSLTWWDYEALVNT